MKRKLTILDNISLQPINGNIEDTKEQDIYAYPHTKKLAV